MLAWAAQKLPETVQFLTHRYSPSPEKRVSDRPTKPQINPKSTLLGPLFLKICSVTTGKLCQVSHLAGIKKPHSTDPDHSHAGLQGFHQGCMSVSQVLEKQEAQSITAFSPALLSPHHPSLFSLHMNPFDRNLTKDLPPNNHHYPSSNLPLNAERWFVTFWLWL